MRVQIAKTSCARSAGPADQPVVKADYGIALLEVGLVLYFKAKGHLHQSDLAQLAAQSQHIEEINRYAHAFCFLV
jgi:hypothetical protein